MNQSKVAKMLSVALMGLSLAVFGPSATAAASGTPLGAGFEAGMTPEQACAHYKHQYKGSFRSNYLCRMLGKKDFSNLTIVNGTITRSLVKGRPVQAVAFYFDESSRLNRVVSVLKPRYGIRVVID